MNERVSSIVCPNCGANAQNHENCEFCGSLLVRFVNKGIDYDIEDYNDKDIVETELGTILQGHLITARQDGIGGVCTHISAYKINSLTMDDDSLCYVVNSSFLKKFSLKMLKPIVSDNVKQEAADSEPFFLLEKGYVVLQEEGRFTDVSLTKDYPIQIENDLESSFILVKIFLNYSKDAFVNSNRWEKSTNIILSSQKLKRRFLKQSFSQLLSYKEYVNEDYTFEIYFIDCGSDIQSAASIVNVIGQSVKPYFDPDRDSYSYTLTTHSNEIDSSHDTGGKEFASQIVDENNGIDNTTESRENSAVKERKGDSQIVNTRAEDLWRENRVPLILSFIAAIVFYFILIHL